jgi:hypothetical protein
VPTNFLQAYQDRSEFTDPELKRISTVRMEMLGALRGFAPTHQAEAKEAGAKEEQGRWFGYGNSLDLEAIGDDSKASNPRRI